MLIDQPNPYRPALPEKLALAWDDFEFALAPGNDQVLGQVAEWAVLNYMCADCDLAPFIFDDLLEMKSVGSSEGLHLCALFDGPLRADSFFARLQPGGTLGGDVVLRWQGLRTADPKTLAMVLRVAGVYPARHRLLFLSGHGNGWRGALYKAGHGVAYQPTNGRLTLPGSPAECDARVRASQVAVQDRLNAAVSPAPAAPRYDILAFDACDMGCLEGIAGLAEHAAILVVSEDQVPGDGYPYARMLRDLSASPEQTPIELARALVLQTAQRYARDPSASAHELTQVALASDALPALAQAFVALVDALSPADAVMPVVERAMSEVYRFEPGGTIDLIGFVQLLLESPLPAPARQAARAVLVAWERTVVAAAVPGGARERNGLSIYAPEPQDYDMQYLAQQASLPWNLGVWSRFLAGYYLWLIGKAEGTPLLEAMQRQMEALIRSGVYVPGKDGVPTRPA